MDWLLGSAVLVGATFLFGSPAFYRRAKWDSKAWRLGGFVTVVIAGTGLLLSNSAVVTFTSVGLVYDVVGVAVLGFAFFPSRTSSLFLNSQTFYGGNRGVLEDGIKARTDGIVGTCLLFLGFILQWLGASDVQQAYVVTGLLLLLGAVVACYAAFIRRAAVEYQLGKADDFKTYLGGGRF